MSEPSVDRVRDDLAVIKQALGFQRGTERDVIGYSVAMAVLGIMLAAITAFTDISRPPAERGSPAHLMYVATLVVPGLLVIVALTALSYRRRDAAPVLWRENRQTVLLTAVMAPIYAGFVAWTAWLGVSASAVTTTTLFLFGLVMLGVAIGDRSRRYWAGWSVATMLAGACAPLCSYRTSGALIGGWLIVGGLSTAILVAYELRRVEVADGHRL